MPLHKIKVCHVVNALDVGGMENGVVNISNLINRSRFIPSICCLYHLGAMAPRLRSDVEVFDTGLPEGAKPLNIIKLALLFRKIRPNVVHTHAWGAGSLYGILGAKIARVPVIINGEHGIFYTKPFQTIAQRLLFHMCDANLSVSESLKNKTSSIIGVPQNKITVIKNGVDTSRFSGAYPKGKVFSLLRDYGFNIDEQSFNIVSIGSLKPDKMQVRLLNALRLIATGNRNIAVKVIFVGDGPDREVLQHYVKRHGLSELVFFLGKRADIPELLSIANILISTSIDEGLSNVMLEAMSSGIPVVSTRSLGAAEIINDGLNGFLVAQDDVEQLTAKIMQLYKDKSLLKTLGSNGRRMIIDHYSLANMVQGYEQLYLNLMEMKKR